MVFGDVTVLRPALLAIVVAVVSAVPVGRTEHAGAPEPARLTATAMDLALASTPTPLSPVGFPSAQRLPLANPLACPDPLVCPRPCHHRPRPRPRPRRCYRIINLLPS